VEGYTKSYFQRRKSFMKLLTFSTNTGLALGLKVESGIIDVVAAGAALGVSGLPGSMAEVVNGGEPALAALSSLVSQAGEQRRAAWLRDEAGLRHGPCMPNPGKILCVGLNYRRHAAESGMPVPTTPVLFSKFNNSLAAHNETVPLPSNAVQYDYEVELGLVIGRQARYVSETEALSYVFGYCTANDLSARDLQNRTSQWILGKTLDKFLPLGPYLVTGDEVGDPQGLAIKTWANGELRQNSNTADMIFSVAQIVSYASQYMTLQPGDVIITGTPEGVILGMAEKNWLKAGDEVTVEVEKLGKLTNPLVAG
jgi:2-keto-4-pentenoate hydratase/2-oxohepta-3-ene-1,7-dioic acid hydratase in catechol pathway